MTKLDCFTKFCEPSFQESRLCTVVLSDIQRFKRCRKLATYIWGRKRTTETDSRLSWLSYLDLEVNISDRRFIFDKQDGFSFHIVNFPLMDSNIPSKLAYGVYIS